jgi:ribosome-interacting GTPase 1
VGASKSEGGGPRTLSLARNADGLILLVDLSIKEPLTQLKTIINELNGSRIRVEQSASGVEVEKRDKGGIQVISFGKFMGETDEIKQFLVENGINNATIRIWGEVDLDEVAMSLISGVIFKPAIVVANKMDADGSKAKLEILKKYFGHKFRIIEVSSKNGTGIEEIPRSIFKTFNIVRIYTKKPRQRPSENPLITRGDVTVEDITKAIHSEFHDNFKYAKVWGSSGHAGKRVGLKYQLKDGDIIEIRT